MFTPSASAPITPNHTPNSSPNSPPNHTPAQTDFSALLPREVIVYMLRGFSARELAAVQRVNRALRDAASDAILYREIELKVPPRILRSSWSDPRNGHATVWINRALASLPAYALACLEQLTVKGGHGIRLNPLCLAKVTAKAPSLTALNVAGVILRSEADVFDALPSGLVALCLGDVGVWDPLDGAPAADGLERLSNFDRLRCLSLTLVSGTLPIDSLPRLRRLALNGGGTLFLEPVMEALALSRCAPTLEALSLEAYSDGGAWVPSLTHFPALTTLACDVSIEVFRAHRDTFVSTIASLQGLESLSVRWPYGSLTEVETATLASGLTRLRHLQFSCSSFADLPPPSIPLPPCLTTVLVAGYCCGRRMVTEALLACDRLATLQLQHVSGSGIDTLAEVGAIRPLTIQSSGLVSADIHRLRVAGHSVVPYQFAEFDWRGSAN